MIEALVRMERGVMVGLDVCSAKHGMRHLRADTAIMEEKAHQMHDKEKYFLHFWSKKQGVYSD